MVYKNLHELINASHSSRDYFLSLPADMQITLHEQSDNIHSPEQLHRLVGSLQNHNHHTALNGGEL